MGPKNLVADCAKFIVIAHALGIGSAWFIDQLLRAESRSMQMTNWPKLGEETGIIIILARKLVPILISFWMMRNKAVTLNKHAF